MVSTTTYAHRALRSLLVFEIRADFTQHTPGTSVTVSLDRCDGAAAVDWSALQDFNVSSSAATAHSLVVKNMEENCDSGHFCPRDVPTHACGALRRCSAINKDMPQRMSTEVGIAYEPLPDSLTLTAAAPVATFVAALRTSLEPGLSGRGLAAQAALATLAQHRSTPGRSAALRESHERGWAAEWAGGIEFGGNLTISSTVNASLYYILAATRPDWTYGLSPGGIARNAYEGHSFWDCETWMFPNMVALFPSQALALTEYRSARLQAARARALTHGVVGAMWPWESALTGT